MTISDYENKILLTIEELKKLPLHTLDQQSKMLKKAFDIAYENDVFSIVDVDAAAQAEARYILFRSLTRYSGTLVFLGIQILAANNIMLSNNFPLRQKYFDKKCGIAINHLRAPMTVISAEKDEDGYRLSGTLTWASGYGIFDSLVVGFHCGKYEYVATVAFENAKGFKVGEVADSFVGESMATVNIDLDQFFVADEHVVAFSPIGSYTKAKSISKTVHIAIYSLGLGAIEELNDHEVKEQASQRLETIKEEFMATNDGELMDHLRIKLFALVQEIITTGMILVGGKSVLANQTLQRYYRELIMFNSNGLNDKIKGLFKERFLNT